MARGLGMLLSPLKPERNNHDVRIKKKKKKPNKELESFLYK